MSEPRFTRQQLGEALQKAAELQEGRADPAAADLIGLSQFANEAKASEPVPRPNWRQRLKQWLRTRGVGIVLALSPATPLSAQQPVGEEAFRVLAHLFTYDTLQPLNARIVERFDTTTFTREKFVYDGWRSSRVPGLLALPKNAALPHPIIVLIDGIGGWKERWWQSDSWNRGRVLVDSLLRAGYGVAMIDIPGSGERRFEIDFANVETFIAKPAQIRDLVLQSTIEHRRLLDHLARRPEIDSARIGALGLSLGGMTTFYLGAVEPRLKALVAGVVPIVAASEAVSPINYAAHVRAPMLMLMGRSDRYYSREQAEQALGLIATPDKRLIWYDTGHRLPEDYARASVAWFRQHLPRR